MFKNRSIGFKILPGCLVIVGLVAVAGAVGYRGIRSVSHSLYVVGDEEAPLVDMANEMKLTLAIARNAMEEFKAASSALATDNAQELKGIVTTYQTSLDDFDTFAEAILEVKTLEDGTVVIKTDNEELAELVRQSDQIHNNKFQVAARDDDGSGARTARPGRSSQRGDGDHGANVRPDAGFGRKA